MFAKKLPNSLKRKHRLQTVVKIFFVSFFVISFWSTPVKAINFQTPLVTPNVNSLCICEHSKGCDALISSSNSTDYYSSVKCTTYCKEKYNSDETGYLKIDPPKFFISAESNEAVNAKKDCDEKKASNAGIIATLKEAVAPRPFVTPNLDVEIPGLTFTKPVGEENVTVNFIGEYINAVYKWLMGVAITLSIVMLMIGGLQYTIGSGTGNLSSAKARMKNAVVGFVLLMSVYLILYTVNPQMTIFKPLVLKTIEAVEIEFENTSLGRLNEITPGDGGKYEILTYEVAKKFDLNGCLLSIQIGKESGWNPKAETGCCFGLGQVNWKNARTLLKRSREEIVSKHSEGCPLCPPADTNDKATLGNWMLNDPEANLIIAAMLKHEVKKGIPNPIAAVAAYGMGTPTYYRYKKSTGCQITKLTDDEFLQQLKAGVSNDTLLSGACVPPNSFPQGKSCPNSIQCCEQATGTCERPTPKKNKEGKNQGRLGVCHTPDNPDVCSAVAGGSGYVKHFISLVKNKCTQ